MVIHGQGIISDHSQGMDLDYGGKVRDVLKVFLQIVPLRFHQGVKIVKYEGRRKRIGIGRHSDGSQEENAPDEAGVEKKIHDIFA